MVNNIQKVASFRHAKCMLFQVCENGNQDAL